MPTTEPQDAYARCAALQRRHDPTFHLATRVLGRDVRPAVHALYGFLRGADELVGGPRRAPTARGPRAALARVGGPCRAPTPDGRRAALDAWQAALAAGIAARGSDHPVIAALVDAG